MKTKLPNLPHKPVGTTLSIATTHPAGRSSMAACGRKTTLKKSGAIIERFLSANIDKFLDNADKIIAEKDYTQPMYNEQAVAYVFTISPNLSLKRTSERSISRML
jgi:hypothetical protein